MGNKNSNWKGDSIGSDGARRRISDKRFSTYIPVPEGYERHHIDGNPHNNDPSNIAIVTRKEHMFLDKRLDKILKLNQARRKLCPHGILGIKRCKECCRKYCREYMIKWREKNKRRC